MQDYSLLNKFLSLDVIFNSRQPYIIYQKIMKACDSFSNNKQKPNHNS